jgi:hypothetical protein
MLFNIGDAKMSVGELTARGCYLGANVSYNLKNLVETGISRRSVQRMIGARCRRERSQTNSMVVVYCLAKGRFQAGRLSVYNQTDPLPPCGRTMRGDLLRIGTLGAAIGIVIAYRKACL